jgi:hypothetical protein
MDFRYTLAGLVVGVLIGFSGVGGGSLMTYTERPLDIRAIDSVIRHAVGAAIILSAVFIGILPFVRLSPDASVVVEDYRWRLAAIGFVVGFVLTITSIGAGAVTLPLLLLLFPAFEATVLVGSDVALGAILVPIAAIGHWSLHNVDLAICGSLLLGSLPGVYIGSRLTQRIPQRFLRPALAGILVVAGSRLI